MAERWFERTLSIIFIVILCLIFGTLLSGQILGLLKIYRPLPVIGCTVLFTAVSLFFFLRMGGLKHLNSFFATPEKQAGLKDILSAVLYIGALILFGFLYSSCVMALFTSQRYTHLGCRPVPFPKSH